MGEVAVVAHYLLHLGLLEKIVQEVRFSRKRFGTYDTIDFLCVLIGYALSGEATLKGFYERLTPFATPFMLLFGRSELPSRAALSRFLKALDQATVETLRTLCAKRSGCSTTYRLRQINRRAVGSTWGTMAGL